MTIKYVSRNEIDPQKWDECIAKSVNGIAYAYSWYLDIVAGEWDALMSENYRAVFPIIKNRRYGIDYIYQPNFAKQLGLFTHEAINTHLVNSFIDAIPSRYMYINLWLNTFTRTEYPKANISTLSTYQLDLIEPYPIISARYSQSTKNSIAKAIANGITVVKGVSAFQILEMKEKLSPNRFSKNQLKILTQIITTSVGMGAGQIYGAYTLRNELCAAIFVITTNKKAIYLLGSVNEEGRATNALHALFDYFIHQNSEKQLVLDFETTQNSDSIRFYLGFGAKACTYQKVTIKKLPWFLTLH